MKRHTWLHYGLIAFAFFATFSYLGCSETQVAPASSEGGSQIIGVPKSPENKVDIPAVISTNPSNKTQVQASESGISASFNMAMDPKTISSDSFIVKDAKGVAVAGSVGMDSSSRTATFKPSNPLACETKYTATINTKARCDGPGEVSAPLPQDFNWSFQTAPCVPPPPSPAIVPGLLGFPAFGGFDDSESRHEHHQCIRTNIISSTSPFDTETGVSLDSEVSATFTREMDAETFLNSTFTLSGPGETPVSGTVSFDVLNRVATFTPTGNLLPGTTYTAVIRGGDDGVRDADDRPLCEDYVWTFTTTSDIAPPTVIASNPICGSIGVPTNQTISVTFSKAMDPLSINPLTFTLTGPGPTIVPGVIVYNVNSFIATFTPNAPLSPSTLYTFTIQGGAPDGVRDAAGNFMVSDFICSFTTGLGPDVTPPTVIATAPTPCGTTGVPVTQNIVVTFDEPILASSISSSTFLVTGPGVTPVAGVVSLDASATIATFTPSSPLLVSTLYTFTIVGGPGGVEDLHGNFMVADFVCTFTTSPSSGGQPPVDLGDASAFAILAQDTITNTGPTVVGGDVGLSPGSAVTGFPPGIVVGGTININNTAVFNAQADLLIAYNDAAGRTVNQQPLPTEIAGLTITPGLYNNPTSVSNSGTVTLDAQGDSSAVFIFQIGSTLTAGVGSQIILAGGAQASNIFWQVGSSATLNTGSIFKGTIMAAVSISTQLGVNVDGRLLAGADATPGGAVTLITTQVAVPTP